ncbi:type VI secretion system Vgr family protein [Massilia consociata]|uniref:Type VI secretion system Vgr family protein n=1 Tax=Massilia consociata TaxID=760117 RepID=A0ABV6FL34_9BURK
MSAVPTEKIIAALAEFSSETRLYALTFEGDTAHPETDKLLVEAFAANDEVQGVGWRDIIAVSTDAHIPLEPMLGKRATLQVRLADGGCASFAGDVAEIAMLGSDGGLARYRLRLTSWLWRLSQVRNCRVWQEKTIIDIVDSVFASYLPLARWRWSDETRYFMDDAAPLDYCCQYRESDLDFVHRLLSEAGLGWRCEQTEEGPGVVLFADSTRLTAIPEDPCSDADDGIRFHRVGACEPQDAVQALWSVRELATSMAMVLSYDHRSKKIVAASAPSKLHNSRKLPSLEAFDTGGQDAYASMREALRASDIQMERREARNQVWGGRSTLRTLRAGTRIRVLDAPLRQLGHAPALTVLRVVSVGVNNMPPPAQYALAELFGSLTELLQDSVRNDEPADFALVVEQARETGYGNCFEALPSDVVWRPQLRDGDRHSGPTAHGSQTAIVVGADGSSEASGADELYCDRIGRVRIHFHWQENKASCWVRVAQRLAGDGMGCQFLPRIGSEVLVQFLEGDINRPVIVGALYNGQGEGGIAPTPGGRPTHLAGTSPFAAAHDHAVSGQGNLAGGNSPVWHGASGDSAGHRNSAAQWGIRSKEFGGSQYNQLVFDDTNHQGRIQLASSCSASELNLGHLIHTADNYRGSFRGRGAELRTDAYGAIRAGSGLLITSFPIKHDANDRDPVGDNAAGIALARQAATLGGTLGSAAVTHQTVALSAAAGTLAQGASVLNHAAAPLQALLTSVSGMVSDRDCESARADAAEKRTGSAAGVLPHASDAIIGISAQAGLGVSAGQSLQLVAGETAATISVQDSQFTTGDCMRKHTGQAIGILGGALKPGEDLLGLQLIAAKDPVDFQALRDTLTIQARDGVNVMSAGSHIDLAAAKRIRMATAGGASITIEGGNIGVQCPGKITVRAGKKSLIEPERLEYPLPRLPREVCIECLLKALKTGSALSLK